MNVQLTPEQRDFLLALVDQELMEIGPELHHTRTSDYREGLKGRRSLLAGLRQALAGARSSALAEPGDVDLFSGT